MILFLLLVIRLRKISKRVATFSCSSELWLQTAWTSQSPHCLLFSLANHETWAHLLPPNNIKVSENFEMGVYLLLTDRIIWTSVCHFRKIG